MSTTLFIRFFLQVCVFVLVSHALMMNIPHWAFALDEPSAESVHTLDPIVVTDTKTPKYLTESTSAVEVFTSEDFEIRKVRTVIDALRLTQGTIVTSNGGPGKQANVRIRGAASDQTLVLIDGAIVNSGTLGSFNFGPLTTDNIENIEILRGAQSMVWGSGCYGWCREHQDETWRRAVSSRRIF